MNRRGFLKSLAALPVVAQVQESWWTGLAEKVVEGVHVANEYMNTTGFVVQWEQVTKWTVTRIISPGAPGAFYKLYSKE